MAVLTLPNTTTQLASLRFGLVPNTQSFVSPLSGAVQTSELSGSKWMATFRMRPLDRAEAQAWMVFLTRLRGMSGRFYAHDPSNATPRGTIPGTPTINGAGQTGSSLNTAGWTAGQTGILLAGDAIAWETATSWRERHIVVSDVDSDGSGLATIALTHPIRESPIDSDSLIVTNAACIMHLIDDQQAFWDVTQALQFGIEFSGMEVFK